MCAACFFSDLGLADRRTWLPSGPGRFGFVKALLLYFIVLSVAVTPCAARTKQTTEQAVVNMIASCVEFYVSSNNGLRPTNWQQLETMFDLTPLNDSLRRKAPESFPIQAHYVFVPGQSLMDETGNVLLIRTSVLKEDGEGRANGRWLVTVKSESASARWRPETQIQAMLAKRKDELPAVDPTVVQIARAKVEAKLATQEAMDRAMEATARNLRVPLSERLESLFGYLRGRAVLAPMGIVIAALAALIIFYFRRR
jgi:hypothetical protein